MLRLYQGQGHQLTSNDYTHCLYLTRPQATAFGAGAWAGCCSVAVLAQYYIANAGHWACPGRCACTATCKSSGIALCCRSHWFSCRLARPDLNRAYKILLTRQTPGMHVDLILQWHWCSHASHAEHMSVIRSLSSVLHASWYDICML